MFNRLVWQIHREIEVQSKRNYTLERRVSSWERSCLAGVASISGWAGSNQDIEV